MTEPADAELRPTIAGQHAALAEALALPEGVPGFDEAAPYALVALAAFIGHTYTHKDEHLSRALFEGRELTFLEEFGVTMSVTGTFLHLLSPHHPLLQRGESTCSGSTRTYTWAWGDLPAMTLERELADSTLPYEQQAPLVARDLTRYLHQVATALGGGPGVPVFTSEALHQVFVDLGDDIQIALSLRDLLTAGVPFGIDLRNVEIPENAKPDDLITLIMPSQRHAAAAWQLALRLIRQPRAGLPEWAFTIRLRVAWELTALATTMELLTSVDRALSEASKGDFGKVEAEQLDAQQAEIAVTLSRAAALDGLPVRRAVAAEYAAYLYNRIALGENDQRENDQGQNDQLDDRSARALLRAAVSSATLAASLVHSPRLAKYAGQNLLELAAREPNTRRGARITQVAEVAFLDHYLAPHLAALAAGPTRASERLAPGQDELAGLGWTRPVVGFTPAFSYAEIPSYRSNPRYLYETVTPTYPRGTFAVDLHAGAVLAVQHFKDLPGSARERTQPLAVFDPTGPVRFPLLEQHPIAWLLMLSDRLLNEVHAGASHPGLVNPYDRLTGDGEPPREDFERLTAAVTAVLDGTSAAAASPLLLPILTRTLLELRAGNSAGAGAANWTISGNHWPKLLAPWTLTSRT